MTPGDDPETPEQSEPAVATGRVTATNKRLAGALIAYAVLFAIAFFILHGFALKAVLILLAGLLAKTLIAWRAGW